MEKVIYQTEYVKLCIDDEVPVIYEKWTGTTTPDEFKSTLSTKLDAFKKHQKEYPSLKWLADIRGLRGLNNDSESWATQDFHPQLYSLGITKIAFIVPEPVFIQLPEEHKTGVMDSKNEIMLCYFDNYDQAVGWLK